MNVDEYPIDADSVVPLEAMCGEDEEETVELRKMLDAARHYITSFKWCPRVREEFFGVGVGSVVAVFLFQFEKPIKGTDEWLWVLEGDMPSAYLVIDHARDPVSALRIYCDLMEEWAEAVLEKRPLDDVFPVNAEAATENAQALLSRMKTLRQDFIPFFTDSMAERKRGKSR